ncbi:outer membrane protein assembly factor BamB family protein [Halopenitus persicus]|uniref:outer membrane protein assembly factor BamB family protein n=1 Tax=Halopenitus persicus TaxID=1048396 RepID=UPI0015A46523|nr:PQQ-binding-like beta-propeller repeat protein [Halopenitus persicus]
MGDVVYGYNGNVFAYSLSDEKFIWETPALTRQLIVTEDYVIHSDPTITALDRKTGEQRWHVPKEEAILQSSRPHIAFTNGTIAAADEEGNLIGTRNGTVRWQQSIPSNRSQSSPGRVTTVRLLSSSENLIRIVRRDQEITRKHGTPEIQRTYVDAFSHDGTPVFHYEFSGYPTGSMVTESRLYLARLLPSISTTDQGTSYPDELTSITVIDTTSGEIVGKRIIPLDHNTIRGIFGFAATDGEPITVQNHRLHRLTPSTLTTKWSSEPFPDQPRQIAVGANTIYAAVGGDSKQSQVRCIDAATGDTIWTESVKADRISQLILVDESLFISTSKPNQLIRLRA